MNTANIQKELFFFLVGLRGQPLGNYYKQFVRECQLRNPASSVEKNLIAILDHCNQSVPYYAHIMHNLGNGYTRDPQAYLTQFPILAKDILRSQFERLKSNDLAQRKWFYNTSGGSTGEPVRFIQDNQYIARTGAVKLLFSHLVGYETGEPQVFLWGSQRDIIAGNEKWRARLINRLTNSVFVNAFRMTPEKMREFIHLVNARRPKLIVAYAEPIYELARFAEREHLEVIPQSAVITSAGMLYPFMREKIGQVFQCPIYNRYGSREVGDIACERPGMPGMWVAPQGNYIEIVDEQGCRVPDGVEGDILLTSLNNYAMPLIRFRIGDRGVMMPQTEAERQSTGQVLQSLLGRNVDCFRTSSGSIVYSAYFINLLFFKDWVARYQVIQKDYCHIVFRIVLQGTRPQSSELDQITGETKILFGDDCRVDFDFVPEIAPTGSGKFRYTVCELPPQSIQESS